MRAKLPEFLLRYNTDDSLRVTVSCPSNVMQPVYLE